MITNSAASVRARLANLVATRGGDFQTLLDEYANERLLCRLALSPHASRFVLKGATLFTIWTGKPHRATKDIDLLGYGDPSAESMERVFREVTAIEIPEDGLVFDPSLSAASRSARTSTTGERASSSGASWRTPGSTCRSMSGSATPSYRRPSGRPSRASFPACPPHRCSPTRERWRSRKSTLRW